MRVYKFTDTDKEQPEVTPEQLIDLMKSGNQFAFGVDNLLQHGTYKLQGWAFDMREELKLYLVKQYGSWYERYAPNKTTLRKLTYGRIDAIKEL